MVSFTEIDKHLYYCPPTATRVFNIQQITRNAGKIGEMGNNHAFVLVLTWIIFTLVQIRVVISFMHHRHLLVLTPTNRKVKSKLIKYYNFKIKQMRSECNKVGSLKILHHSTMMKIRPFKIQRRRKRGSHGGVTRETNLEQLA